MNSPSCAFVTSLAGSGASPLLIRIGGVELESDFSRGLVVPDGAWGVLNSSMWSQYHC